MKNGLWTLDFVIVYQRDKNTKFKARSTKALSEKRRGRRPSQSPASSHIVSPSSRGQVRPASIFPVPLTCKEFSMKGKGPDRSRRRRLAGTSDKGYNANEFIVRIDA